MPVTLKLQSLTFSQTQNIIILTSCQREGETPWFKGRVNEGNVEPDLGQRCPPSVVGGCVSGDEGDVERTEVREAINDVGGIFEDH